MTLLSEEITFSNPGIYHVRILGNAAPELWDNFEGTLEKFTTYKNGQVVSTLKFHVRDQVELSGIIDVLCRYRHVLLTIQRDSIVKDQAEADGTS